MPLFLLPLLKWIGGFLTGPLLQGALQAYQAKLSNDNNADQRTATLLQQELAVEQRQAELNTQLQLADEGHIFTRSVRPAFAYLFLLYDAKLVIWDKMLNWGVTDPLSDQLVQIEMLVLGFYFGGRSLEKIAAVLKRK